VSREAIRAYEDLELEDEILAYGKEVSALRARVAAKLGVSEDEKV
jgi:hypothetical protein